MSKALYLFPCVALVACASSAPVKIGGDTYYSSKTNTAGIFGDVGAVAGALMAEAISSARPRAKSLSLSPNP
jgi:hypothetical protein